MKYIVVTGGVLSGLGKGITTSSIGKILISSGLKVMPIKIDPYINCDAGTMNPYQHGEVFVLNDGGEVDLDLGNYERFMDIDMNKDNNITTGKVYLNVIERERKGEYLGETVQIIPHITGEIKNLIKKVGTKSSADIILIEVGGTVGDIESMPFLEALRELKLEVGEDNILFIHTTLVPVVGPVGEQKTKPTQHSVKELRSIGITPNIIIARGSSELTESTKKKISLFCEVPVNNIISAPDLKTVYELPLVFQKQNLYEIIKNKLKLVSSEPNLQEWNKFVERLNAPKNEIRVAMVGKYSALKDSYISYSEALNHCSAETSTKIIVDMISAEQFEKGKDPASVLEKYDGIIIPGGFGNRGIEGKIKAITYARESKKPFLGVCLGFQLAVIEYSRNVLKLDNANSTEFNESTPYPVVTLLPEQKNVSVKGASMRLGSSKVIIKEGSKAHEIYSSNVCYERHRHRYEINPDYIPQLEEKGFIFSGMDEEKIRMEIAELKNHPFFVCTQFHPELKSRVMKPAPVLLHFVKACLKKE
ncbi:MAG: glutamine hydrolyzing CTP synthase [Thermoplasmata archaeon]